MKESEARLVFIQ